MTTPAIKAEDIGKQYRIGGKQEYYYTLRESLAHAVLTPVRRLMHGTSDDSHDDRLFWALRHISFSVGHGEVLGVIGRNGAGKSTLLKILTRITDPTEGYARLYGRVGSLLEVGTGFHPELTGRENIFLSGAVLGMKKREIAAKFDEIVAFAGVELFLDTPVKRYSTGMHFRLAFAVAAHLEPEILLVDEVLATGDAEFQRKCMGKMQGVAGEGRTVLFVSHNMNAVEQLCSSVMLLDGGEIKELSRDVRSVVNAYLFQAGELSAQAEWTAADSTVDSDWFTPLRFAITDREGRTLPLPARNDDDMWVRIEGIVKRNDPVLALGYAAFSQSGQMLYLTLDTDAAPERRKPLPLGRVVLSSRIPPRFLNEGDYRLEFVMGLHTSDWLLAPGRSSISAVLTISGGLSDSPYWMERREGVLAPEMEWVVE